MELTVHKESVVVEEIQEVERHARFIYDRNYNRIGSQPCSCTYEATSYEEVNTFVSQKAKSKGICIEGYLEKYNFLLFLRILNLQPRRRSVRSNKSVLLIHVLSRHVLLIHVLSIQSVITSFNKLQQDSQKIHRHASHRRETFLTRRSVKLLFDMRCRPNLTSHDTVHVLPIQSSPYFITCHFKPEFLLDGERKLFLMVKLPNR